jgi:SAM-dependent methyltransferase
MSNFEGHYIEWRKRRLDFILGVLGPDFFKGKTLLEVGAGYGDIGNFFHGLGARVTCTDARQEHLDVMSLRYPHINTFLYNLDDRNYPKGHEDDHYDVVVHMGVLYHLRRSPDSAIRRAVSHLNTCGTLILESEVADSDDPFYVRRRIEPTGYDQGVSTKGNRPSAAYVERVLGESCTFTRYDSMELNSIGHRYTWKVKNTGSASHGKRRFWIAKRTY